MRDSPIAIKTLVRIFIIGLFLFGATLFFIFFLFFNQKSTRKGSAAVIENVALNFTPSTESVVAGQTFTVTVSATSNMSASTDGYTFGVVYDPSKVQFDQIKYIVGQNPSSSTPTPTIGVSDPTATPTQSPVMAPLPTGNVRVKATIPDSGGYPLVNGTPVDVVALTFTAITADPSAVQFTTDATQDYFSWVLGGATPVSAGNTLSINGGQVTPTTSGGFTLSGQVIANVGPIATPLPVNLPAPGGQCTVPPASNGVNGETVTLTGNGVNLKTITSTGTNPGEFAFKNVPANTNPYQLCYVNSTQYNFSCSPENVEVLNPCLNVVVSGNSNHIYVVDAVQPGTTPTITPTPSVTPGLSSGYQVSGRVLTIGNVPPVSAAFCPTDPTGYSGVDGMKVTLTGNGLNLSTQTLSMTAGVVPQGLFSFTNVPANANPYQLCYTNNSTNPFYCAQGAATSFSNCESIKVGNADVTNNIFYVTTASVGTGSTTINLKLRFQGITTKPRIVSPLQTQVKIYSVNLTPITQTVTFIPGDNGVWSGTMKVNLTTGTTDAKYSIFVKGPKHLRKRICAINPIETRSGGYNCITDAIAITPDTVNDLDFSGITLLGGDLPVTNDQQDGVIDASDTSFIRANFGSTDPTVLSKGDINLDGIIDTQDFSIVVAALAIKYDDPDP